MHYSLPLVAALASVVSAHGVVTSIQGANGVTMPGLSIADGTPRDCSTNLCGSQADTSIIRDREINSGECGPLGRTQGNGPVSAETMIRNFMGEGTAPRNDGASESVGVEDEIPNLNQRKRHQRRQLGNLLNSVTGGGGNGGGALGGLVNDLTGTGSDSNGGTGGAIGGLLGGLTGGVLGGGGNKNDGPPESSVASSAGVGASEGLPTCDDDGTITMTYRQINQDGAGPLRASVDGTSGGTDPNAFQTAEVTQDVPGLGIQGLSLATNTDFPLKVRMPEGMTCDATVAGVENVCVVRVRNGAAAGPFGGSAAFTQSPAARKRAIAFRLKKRMEFNNRS